MRLIYRIKQLILMGGDWLCFTVGFYLGLALRNLKWPEWVQIEKHLALFFVIFLLWIIINFINGLYDLGELKKPKSKQHFIEAALISLVISVIFFYLFPNQQIAPKTILLLNVIIGYGFSYLWREIYNKFISAQTLHNNIIFIGYTPETQELIDILQKYPERDYRTVALIDPVHMVKSSEFPDFDVYYSVRAIRPAITNHKAQVVAIAQHLKENDEAMRELYELLFWNVQVIDLPSLYEVITGRITPSTFSEGWFLDHLKNSNRPIYDKMRNFIDYLAALILGTAFILFFPIIALGIKANSKGPIFIKQKRVGQFGRHFIIYKFRSMLSLSPDGLAETDGAQFAKKEDERITFIGKLLRKTHLDELPQCWNLLKGDISLIGPRPERPEIVEKLEAKMPYYSLRHMIKPGLTGWAAIHQNYTDTLETSLQKLQYDLFYIKNRSPLLDLFILLKTINVVIRMMGQ